MGRTMRPARIQWSGQGQSGVRRSIARRWLVLLALLCLASGCAQLPAVGLRPLPYDRYNPARYSVDSLRPTLRWESFPRPEDLEADKAGRLAAVRNQTYELRIWRAEGDFPSELVYARSGLTEPVHTVETPLAPDTDYQWTIRARFELNGEPRVTEWAVFGLAPEVAVIPLQQGSIMYYWFRTPSR